MLLDLSPKTVIQMNLTLTVGRLAAWGSGIDIYFHGNIIHFLGKMS
jgi:hypothetical protein